MDKQKVVDTISLVHSAGKETNVKFMNSDTMLVAALKLAGDILIADAIRESHKPYWLGVDKGDKDGDSMVEFTHDFDNINQFTNEEIMKEAIKRNLIKISK